MNSIKYVLLKGNMKGSLIIPKVLPYMESSFGENQTKNSMSVTSCTSSCLVKDIIKLDTN